MSGVECKKEESGDGQWTVDFVKGSKPFEQPRVVAFSPRPRC
jgi:hypothetical protein